MERDIVSDQVDHSLRGELVEKTEILAFTRDETIALLKSQGHFGKALKEALLFVSEQQLGIMNAFLSQFRTKIPWTLIAILMIILAVIGMFSINPQYAQGISQWGSLPQNQMIIGIILVIFLVIIIFMVRRGKRRSNTA